MRCRMLAVLMLLSPGCAAAQSLDAEAARLREQAYLQAWSAPIGQATAWHDPASGDHGRITPLRERKTEGSSEVCRDMAETLTVAGALRHGTASGCRGVDRIWHVVTATPGDSDPGDPASVPADLPPYQAPADISADAPRNGQAIPPGVIVRIRPQQGRGTAAPEIFLAVPPPPPAESAPPKPD
jgi:surface antigen